MKRAQEFSNSSSSAHEHTMQREKQLREAARDAAIDRLISEQRQRDRAETRRRG